MSDPRSDAAATTPRRRRTPGLSKSRVLSGLQCPLLLWWRAHEPDAPELVPDASLQAIFDQGTRVGEVARGYVPGGVLVDAPAHDFAARLGSTRRALDRRAPAIYEAAFSADGVFVAVDILARERSGWRVIEVKSSTQVKDVHVLDAAIQVHVLRRAGLEITGADVMVLDRACTHPDLSNLFAREDVTDRIEATLDALAHRIPELKATLAGPRPLVATGPHCEDPYPCPFMARCWPAPLPHDLSTLHNTRRATLERLRSSGYATVHDLPEGLGLNTQAERQRRAVQAGRLLVEGDLAGALADFAPPLAFLDFETVMPAIPVWDGCHPYDAVPAQFSCHREDAGGLRHEAWVADGPGDPRAEIARRVVAACRGARTVLAYNMSFERRCLEALADALPAQAADLHDVIGRLADPLPVVRDHVYHPDFGGSFSLKTVAPALAPELSYDGLEIADGTRASQALHRLVLDGDAVGADERARVREALLRYCERDTLGMVRVVERLRALAAS